MIESVAASLPTFVTFCTCYFWHLCTRQEEQLISVRRNVEKKPPNKPNPKHCIGGRFHCCMHCAQIFISDFVLFWSSRHLSSWRDHGDASPLGRYPGERPSSAAVLPPSKAARPFFEGDLLVWWGTVPSVLFKRQKVVDTLLMPSWWGHDEAAPGGESLQSPAVHVMKKVLPAGRSNTQWVAQKMYASLTIFFFFFRLSADQTKDTVPRLSSLWEGLWRHVRCLLENLGYVALVCHAYA